MILPPTAALKRISTRIINSWTACRHRCRSRWTATAAASTRFSFNPANTILAFPKISSPKPLWTSASLKSAAKNTRTKRRGGERQLTFSPVALVYPEPRRASSRHAPRSRQPSLVAQELVHHFRHKNQPHSLRLRLG